MSQNYAFSQPTGAIDNSIHVDFGSICENDTILRQFAHVRLLHDIARKVTLFKLFLMVTQVDLEYELFLVKFSTLCPTTRYLMRVIRKVSESYFRGPLATLKRYVQRRGTRPNHQRCHTL